MIAGHSREWSPIVRCCTEAGRRNARRCLGRAMLGRMRLAADPLYQLMSPSSPNNYPRNLQTMSSEVDDAVEWIMELKGRYRKKQKAFAYIIA
jgi:hypothetical protein